MPRIETTYRKEARYYARWLLILTSLDALFTLAHGSWWAIGPLSFIAVILIRGYRSGVFGKHETGGWE